MKRLLVGAVALWVTGLLLLAALVLQPAGDGPAASGAGALTILAASNQKEGQGDVTCGASGPVGAGATVAVQAAQAAGFTGADLVTAVAIAGAESGWRSDATHLNADGSTDYGLWQINSVHAVLLASGDWRDPYSNARMAHQIWVESHGWTPWSTYTSGAYLQRVSAAQAAVSGAPAPTCTTGGAAAGPDHLTPWTRTMRDTISKAFPGLVVGCYRALEDGGEHPRGRACDFMVPVGSATGDALAAYAQQHATSLHIMYVIYRQHIWSPARADEGWRPMEDRGSITANHFDHVHVSVLP